MSSPVAMLSQDLKIPFEDDLLHGIICKMLRIFIDFPSLTDYSEVKMLFILIKVHYDGISTKIVPYIQEKNKINENIDELENYANNLKTYKDHLKDLKDQLQQKGLLTELGSTSLTSESPGIKKSRVATEGDLFTPDEIDVTTMQTQKDETQELNKLDELNKEIDSLNKEIDSLNEKINKLQNQHLPVNEVVTEVNTAVTAVNTDIQNLNKTIIEKMNFINTLIEFLGCVNKIVKKFGIESSIMDQISSEKVEDFLKSLFRFEDVTTIEHQTKYKLLQKNLCPPSKTANYTIDSACSNLNRDNSKDDIHLCELFKGLCEIKNELDKNHNYDIGVALKNLIENLGSLDNIKRIIGELIYKTGGDFLSNQMKAFLYYVFIEGIKGIASNSKKGKPTNKVVVDESYANQMFFIFSDDISKFCKSDSIDDTPKNSSHITFIHTLYYDVFCNDKLKVLNTDQQTTLKFVSDGLDTYTIKFGDSTPSDLSFNTFPTLTKDITFVPNFIGVLVMLMTEIKHDFKPSRTSKKKNDDAGVDFDKIQEMVKYLLLNYASDALTSPQGYGYFGTGDDQNNIIEKINNFFEEDFVYLQEEGCQNIMLEIYSLKKIICVQEVPNGTNVLSRPEKITSPFPAVLAKNKNVILSADAKNTLGISINSIKSIYKLQKEDFPFLSFDAGNSSNISEQTDTGEAQFTSQETGLNILKSYDDSLTQAGDLTKDSYPNFMKYNIQVCDLWGENVFEIYMHMKPMDTLVPKVSFTLFFNMDVTSEWQSLTRSALADEDNEITFNSVSITEVTKIYNQVDSIIKQYSNSGHTYTDHSTGNTTRYEYNNNTDDKFLANILVSIISLKSMGDLLTYYITLIEGVDNLNTNINAFKQSGRDEYLNTNVEKEFIGVVSSADFSLMQLPLVKIMKKNASGNLFSDYNPPCSLFAAVHIKNSEYVVPLKNEEKEKIILWDYISNADLNNNDFNYVRYFINYFYSIYWFGGPPNDINTSLFAELNISSTTEYEDFCRKLNELPKDQLREFQEKMVEHATCECKSFFYFEAVWQPTINEDELQSKMCDIYRTFLVNVFKRCFDPCNEIYNSIDYDTIWFHYFPSDKYNIRYDDPKLNKSIVHKDYYFGKIDSKNQNGFNVTYYDNNTAIVPEDYLKPIFNISSNIRTRDEKLYSLAEWMIANCDRQTQPSGPQDTLKTTLATQQLNTTPRSSSSQEPSQLGQRPNGLPSVLKSTQSSSSIEPLYSNFLSLLLPMQKVSSIKRSSEPNNENQSPQKSPRGETRDDEIGNSPPPLSDSPPPLADSSPISSPPPSPSGLFIPSNQQIYQTTSSGASLPSNSDENVYVPINEYYNYNNMRYEPLENLKHVSSPPPTENDGEEMKAGGYKNKNTKTYKKKYIKNKINKTYGNKNINNKMNNTRSNKKLNKKHINTLRKK